MNFSFCCPTLGNKEMVCKTLDSFERTTRYKNKIEFLFAIDPGNYDTIKSVEDKKYGFSIRFFERGRSDDFVKDYYNFLANKSIGNNVIPFNDDAWMRTQDWDKKLLDKIKEYGWSIYLVDLLDTARIKYKHQFSCFPCISRRGMNTLGWMLCEDVRMYPADSLTYSVYQAAGRVIPVNNILIEHEHIIESDNSKSRLMKIFNEDMQKNIDINPHIMRLVKTCSGERLKKETKLNRILNILKE